MRKLGRETHFLHVATTKDISLKFLLGSRPQRLFKHICGVDVRSLEPREWQAVQLRPDLFGRLDNEEWLHAEVQADPDRHMPWRMLGYRWLAWNQYGIRVLRQIVFVLRGKASRMPDGLDLPGLQYRYQVVFFEEIDHAVLAGGTPEESILSILCKGGATPGRIREVLRQCLTEPEPRRQELIEHLKVLSVLRPNASQTLCQELKTMPITIDLSKTIFWKEAKAEGRKEGRAEGRAEAQQATRALLRKAMIHQFGRLPAAVEDRLAAATPQELDRWSDRVFTAKSVADLMASGERPRRAVKKS